MSYDNRPMFEMAEAFADLFRWMILLILGVPALLFTWLVISGLHKLYHYIWG